jgi:uncharacterized membrane protein
VKNYADNSNQTIPTININKKNFIIITVLIVTSCIIGGCIITYITHITKPPGYHEIYILDRQNQAISYPQTIIINQNNTFNAPLTITNNMQKDQEYQLQIKIVHNTITFPVDALPYNTCEFTLSHSQNWNSQIPITINEKGNYSIVFELYTKQDGDYVFTHNYCVLHVNAIANIT